MVAKKVVTVKLAEDRQAVVGWDGVEVLDTHPYTPRLVAAMDLDDAIALAKAVLAFAGSYAEDDVER